MFYKEFIPHPALQQHIKCFWIFENSYGPNHCERMIPDGYIDLVFHYGQRPKLAIDGKEVHKPADFLGGHLVNAALLRFSGNLKMFGIKFYPWASASLYKMPAYELNNLRIPVAEILGKWVNEYWGMMYEELNRGNYRFVIGILENILCRKLYPEDKKQQLLKYCFGKIMLSKGSATISSVSKELGYSPRYTQKIFKEKKGMPFQHYCRLYRLQNVLKKIKSDNDDSLTGLAHASGYYDQSHFIRDFTAFTGLTPLRFISEEHLYISQNLETLQ